jgi:NAD(P)-dependent dehydrogenase (short-subunit alcohol dehydrogenase family)
MTAEWAADGLQINAIAPGYIHTEMTQNLVDDEAFNVLVAYGASFRYTLTCCRLVAV